MGVKIAAHGLEKAVAGTSVLVAEHEDEIPELQVREEEAPAVPIAVLC
jgi:hypothetical protein